MKRRLKVLVSAYSCDPTRGSEPGVGWGWVKALSRHHDLLVLTSDLFRANIEAELHRDPALRGGLQFHYVPRTRYLRLSRLWKPALLWTYRRWQQDAYRLALQLQRDPGFDLVHQLTWVTFREPGHLWKLDVPFVWGPIGGLENTPWRLLPMLGVRGLVHFASRNVLNTLHKRLLPRPKRAFRKAHGGIIAATEGIRREILRHYGQESQVICETAPPEPIAATHSIRVGGAPLRISWSGAHDPGKALPLLLHAVVRLPGAVGWELHILGEGPCTTRWRRVARRLGVDSRCTWHGQLPRPQAIALLGSSHVFALTSVKDLTTTVVMEALSQGVPVVCLDHCGFAGVVTSECGVKVPVGTPDTIGSRFADALGHLWAHEAERQKLAAGALERVRQFTFERKAEAVSEIYHRALGRGGSPLGHLPRHRQSVNPVGMALR